MCIKQKIPLSSSLVWATCCGVQQPHAVSRLSLSSPLPYATRLSLWPFPKTLMRTRWAKTNATRRTSRLASFFRGFSRGSFFSWYKNNELMESEIMIYDRNLQSCVSACQKSFALGWLRSTLPTRGLCPKVCALPKRFSRAHLSFLILQSPNLGVNKDFFLLCHSPLASDEQGTNRLELEGRNV